MNKSLLNEARKLHIRTVSAILIWVVVALLLVNSYFKSELIFLISIAILVIAVLVYFIPRLMK
jgi:hypothetical protein